MSPTLCTPSHACIPSLIHRQPPLCMHAHASVTISHYKCKNKCVKCAHIAYQPISAEIYLLATYSALAQEYHVHYMHVSQHIFCFALCVPANIYVGMLLAIQLTYIIFHI